VSSKRCCLEGEDYRTEEKEGQEMNLVNTLPLLSSHVLLSFASFLSLHSATSIISLSSHLVSLALHALQLPSNCFGLSNLFSTCRNFSFSSPF
jgi:hypothetical protein